MINKRLRDMALPVPDAAMMHDWWLALIAAAFGQIGHISRSTLLYRQHVRSDIGAKAWNLKIAFRQLLDMPNTLVNIRKTNLQLQAQAKAFLERYKDILSDSDKEMIDVYSQLSKYTYWERRYYLVKYKFFYTDTIRNIGRLLFA